MLQMIIAGILYHCRACYVLELELSDPIAKVELLQLSLQFYIELRSMVACVSCISNFSGVVILSGDKGKALQS